VAMGLGLTDFGVPIFFSFLIDQKVKSVLQRLIGFGDN